MGATYAAVTLRSNGRQAAKRLLVDTGATYSWVEAALLRKLGVKPEREMKFETIEDKLIKKQIGFIDVECLGVRATTVVVFATGRDSEVLGLHALEGLALEVDPVHRILKKSKAVMALLSNSSSHAA